MLFLVCLELYLSLVIFVSGSTVEVREDCIIIYLSKSDKREKVDSGASKSCSCLTSVRRAESSSSLVGFASVALDVVDDIFDDVAMSSTIGAGWSENLDKICGAVGVDGAGPDLVSSSTVDCVDAIEDENAHVHFDLEVVIIGAE